MLISAGLAQLPKPKPRFAATCDVDPNRHVPYSAEFKLTNTYPGPDGTLVTYNYSEVRAFDSHGRFLGATTSPDPKGVGLPSVTASVCDPTRNEEMEWESLKKRVVVLKLPMPSERNGCWESEQGDHIINFDLARRSIAEAQSRVQGIDRLATDPERPNRLIEDLGTTYIQGLKVHGVRTTWPPADSSAGNTEPPYEMEEHWESPLLGTWVKQEVDYPSSIRHNLKWTRALTSVNLREPDPSIFEPPSDYTVITETMHRVDCDSRQ